MADIARTIIEAAARHLGALESGVSLTDDEAQDGLRALAGMMGVWGVNGLQMFAENLVTHTLVAGTPSYTIGPAATGADIVAQRPTGYSGFRGAWIRDTGNIDRAIRRIVPYKQYEDIWAKVTQAPYADILALDPGTTISTIHLYPTPSEGNTLRMLYVALIEFTALNDAFELPPGYQEAIEYNLAIRLGPQFELEASRDVRDLALESKKAIERPNAVARIGKRVTDVPRMPGTSRGRYEITSDEWR